MAVAQLLIDPNDLRVMDNAVTPTNALNDATTAYVESQARVLTSDTVLRKVIEQQRLDKDPEFAQPPSAFRAALTVVLQKLGLATQRDPDPIVAVLQELAPKVGARRQERTYVVDLTASTRDPEKSARIANAIIAAYLEDQADCPHRLREARDRRAVRAAARAEGPGARGREPRRDLQGAKQSRQRERPARQRAAAERAHQPAHRRGREGRRGQGAPRPDRGSPSRPGGCRRHRRSGAIPDGRGAARPACRGAAPQGRAHRAARRASSLDRRHQRAGARSAATGRPRSWASLTGGARRLRAGAGDAPGAARAAQWPEAGCRHDQPVAGAVARARTRGRGQPRGLSGLSDALARDERAGARQHHQRPRALRGECPEQARVPAAHPHRAGAGAHVRGGSRRRRRLCARLDR